MASIILASPITNTAGNAVNLLAGNFQLLAAGICLIVIAFIVVMMLKRIIVNSLLGLIAWALIVFVLKIDLQLIPTLVISVIFGLAGVGAVLLLKFFGIPI